MRILGIDPGIHITGYCILDVENDGYELVNCGSVQTDKSLPTQKRLLEIFNDIVHICEKYSPDTASIEQIFFFKNQKTIIPVVQARGVILAALEKCSVPSGEYTPMVVKQMLTGHGRASKDDVKVMVEKFVTLNENTRLDDTIDSVAIAICHSRNLAVSI